MTFQDEFEFRCEDTCDKSFIEIKYHNDKRLTGARSVLNRSDNILVQILLLVLTKSNLHFI